LEQTDLPGHRAGEEVVIRVEEYDVLASRHFEAGIPRRRQAPVCFENVLNAVSVTSRHGLRVVIRPVVHDDHLERSV
jgi:hypothetical protein